MKGRKKAPDRGRRKYNLWQQKTECWLLASGVFMADSPTLQIQGLNELEIAEIKQELLGQGIDFGQISAVQRPDLESTKVGEPAIVKLLIDIAPQVAPVIAGALAAWLLKGRKAKKKKQFTFSLNKGKIQLGYASSDEFVEQQTKETIQEKILGFVTR
jgi:hypothetical protein